ncbi:hypothetical protein EMCRGX_G008880 [Ephydatia muelleri]
MHVVLIENRVGYKVTVSALTNGSIPVDSTVTLFCTIDSTPPMPLSYVWYSSAPGNYINNQGPSATVYIFPRERKLSLYFCHVQSNGSDVAVGYISIKPQGFLIPIGPTEVTYHYGDNIVLEVSLSSNPIAQYIQSPQWYKDGSPLPVNCSSDMRVCTNTTETRLTIQRAGNSDEGQYTVKIKNIQGVDNSYGCIQNLLSLLEGHYAAHSPVTFTVSSSLVKGGTDQVSVEPTMYVIPTRIFNVEKASSIGQYQFQSCLDICLNCPNPIYRLFFNGVQRFDNRAFYFLRNGRLTLFFTNATPNEFGVFEVVANICEGLYWAISCIPPYIRDVLIDNDQGWAYVIERFIVQIYVPPQVSLQAVPPHPSSDSPVIVITCAALNGTPDVHNITLMKNGSVLETVVGGNTLTYTVTWSGLGQYVCEVDSLYSTHQESIVLKESAMAKLQLMSMTCENLAHLCQNEPSYVQKMTTQLRYLTESLCSCTLSNDTFTQANVTCPSNNEPWSAVVSVWVKYASDDGMVTASDLISMIQN